MFLAPFFYTKIYYLQIIYPNSLPTSLIAKIIYHYQNN